MSINYLVLLGVGVLFITYNKPYTGLIVFPLSLLLVIGDYFNWSILKLKTVSVFILLIFVFLMFCTNSNKFNR